MALEVRKRLMHALLTFDADSDGPLRLKDGVTLMYLTGMWDTERNDPRPRDGLNAPVNMPPQTGFWVEGVPTQTKTEALTAASGVLPDAFRDQLNEAIARGHGDAAASLKDLQAAVSQLRDEVASRDKTIGEREATIASLRQDIEGRDKRAATIEERVEALEAAAGAKAA